MASDNDVVDVEFETIRADGKSAGQKPRSKISQPAQDSQSGEEQLAVFGSVQQPAPKPMSLPLFTFVSALCVVAAFFVSGGHSLFASSTKSEIAPASAPAHIEDVALKFENVTSNILERSTGRVLNIRATVHNTDKVAHTIPPVLVHLGDNSATASMFRIQRGEILNPGEKLVFTSSMPVGNSLGDKPELSFSQ